jgi:hypothetical protein
MDRPPPHSGSRLLQISAQGLNLLAQRCAALEIATGTGDSQSEFEFFQLMVALGSPQRHPGSDCLPDGRAV